jgi:NAD(P)-dependent dehydrogenase (short-subunit alcohol dehydrogenase family)
MQPRAIFAAIRISMMTTPSVRSLLDFSGKTVLVTGASGGIGAGTALRFAEAGAKVAVHYRSDRQGADKIVTAIKNDGGEAHAFHAELSMEKAVVALFDGVVERFGVIDITINNAGMFPNSTIADMSLDEWQAMYASNTDTLFLCTREAAARMKPGGAIINIASIAAMNAGPEHAHYNSAKAAVVMFSQSAAQEYGPKGIRVNTVSPGVIGRDGIRDAWPDGVARWEAKAPLGRLGSATDIADACLFLASPAASFITGANLPVEGGVLASPIY